MNLSRISQWTAILALSCLTPAAAELSPGLSEVGFEEHDVDLEAAGRLTVLTGFLLDGAIADLAVARVDATGARRLRIYEHGAEEWTPVVDARLRPGVLFVDVANLGGRDRLVTYGGGRFAWFDPDSATERPLLELATGYRPTDRSMIPHVDLTRDLNHDGLDDLIVPGVDGFRISTQSRDGTFTGVVKLGPPEPFAGHPVGNLDVDETRAGHPKTYGDVGITTATIPVYLNRVHEMDHDLDGRSDLVFWNQDHFDVYYQDESGLFDPVAETFTVEVPFDSDGAYSRAFDYADEGVFSALLGLGKKTERTVLRSLRDFDGDGIADLMTQTLAGRNITRQQSRYEVHFGRSTSDGVMFAKDVGVMIRPRGRAGGIELWGYAAHWFEDFDGDDQIDILFQDVKVGVGGMMRALVGNSVPLNLELYRMEEGTYPDRPTAKQRIRRFAPFAGVGNIFFPTVLVGDVNGDGRSDVLVGAGPNKLQVFLGIAGPDVVSRKPQELTVAVPYNERNSWLADLNRDDKRDLVIYHAPTERSPTEPHRVTMLIAR